MAIDSKKIQDKKTGKYLVSFTAPNTFVWSDTEEGGTIFNVSDRMKARVGCIKNEIKATYVNPK